MNLQTNDNLFANAYRKSKELEAAKNPYAKYKDDPVGFFEEVLGLKVWSKQKIVLESIRDSDKVAVKAGRKVSKSNTIAGVSIWWTVARRGRVLMTSSSAAQIKSILWYELSTLAPKVVLKVPLEPSTGIRDELGKLIIEGRSADKRENMQGYSGADVLYIADETSGIKGEMLEALEGNLAGGGKIAYFSNPTQTSGRFYEVFHPPVRDEWCCITISSRESPNITGEMYIPGLATQEWISSTEREYGEDSPYVECHIDGKFPSQASGSVIPLSVVDAAKARYAETEFTDALKIGIDVARYGDDESVIQPVAGLKTMPPKVIHSMDGIEVAGHAIQIMHQLREKGFKQKITVNVDVIGYGSSCFDHLNKSDQRTILNYEVFPIDVQELATNEKYARLRDQIWFSLADWLAEGGAIHHDVKLDPELLAATYGFDVQGRYKVDPKDDVKKIIKRSPDRADALGLAVYKPMKVIAVYL